MPRVSIITISYNNAGGLLRTIESVVRQDFTDYEYIVIDGGSSDHSKNVIETFKQKISYWISEPDRGVYHAMNKAINISNGEYIHFLNSGDVYASDIVLKEIFKKDHDVPLIRGAQICDYGTKQERWLNLGPRDVTLYDMYVNTLLHQATFIRKDLFDKYGTYDENLRIVSDWKFFLKTILGGEKTIFIDLDIVIFEMNGISTNKEHGDLHLSERKQVLEELIPAHIRTDYERLKYLEQDAYIGHFIKENKVVYKCFKATHKIFKLFKKIFL